MNGGNAARCLLRQTYAELREPHKHSIGKASGPRKTLGTRGILTRSGSEIIDTVFVVNALTVPAVCASSFFISRILLLRVSELEIHVSQGPPKVKKWLKWLNLTAALRLRDLSGCSISLRVALVSFSFHQRFRFHQVLLLEAQVLAPGQYS